MSTVRSLVSAIEAKLHAAAPARSGVHLASLGDSRLTGDGQPVRMRRRQLEILTLLALQPNGMTPEQLHFAVYGDRRTATSTLKADISNLRKATGVEIASRVYRLISPISCDAVDLLAALKKGDTATALRLYRGPLLPGSELPGVVDWRQHFEVAVRTAVLASANADHALQLGEHAVNDAEIHESALRLLPVADGRRAIAAARLHTAIRL
ncbi:AfsR/SARP family transcriptional regulator [Nocardioides sp. AN3]